MDLGHLAGIARDAMLRYDVTAAELAGAIGRSATRYGYPSGRALLNELVTIAGVPLGAIDLVAAIEGRRIDGYQASEELQSEAATKKAVGR
jgi:hypothetical protein